MTWAFDLDWGRDVAFWRARRAAKPIIVEPRVEYRDRVVERDRIVPTVEYLDRIIERQTFIDHPPGHPGHPVWAEASDTLESVLTRQESEAWKAVAIRFRVLPLFQAKSRADTFEIDRLRRCLFDPIALPSVLQGGVNDAT